MMDLTLPRDDFEAYVARLIENHVPDQRMPPIPSAAFGRALDRVEHCFSRIERKYYKTGDRAVLDHLNGDHMASFLYFLANTVWRETGDAALPTRLFYANKIMHGLDLFYSVAMPNIFLLVHPLGTVLGNATYGDYLVVYQNCTVGAVTTVYPTFGVGTVLYSRTSVIGDCKVGNDVVFAANSFVLDCAVPDNSVVVGQHPAQRFLKNTVGVRARHFDPVGGTQR
jgi:serine O-acetyltransferase